MLNQNQARSNTSTHANATEELELTLVPMDDNDETVYIPVNHLASKSTPFTWNDMYAAA